MVVDWTEGGGVEDAEGGWEILGSPLDQPPAPQPPAEIDMDVDEVNDLYRPSTASPSKGESKEGVTVHEDTLNLSAEEVANEKKRRMNPQRMQMIS